MKKIVYILIIANLFLNCETKKSKSEFNKVEFHYPRETIVIENPLFQKIYLDSVENFSELMVLANQISCNKKWVLLVFETDKNKFKFELYKECSESNDIVDYSRRNVISIQMDSIIINDELGVPLDSLKTVLKNHILNPNQELDYSQNIEKALIFYNQDSIFPSQKIKEQLIKISENFNELNTQYGDSLPLKIKLSEYPYIRILTPNLPEK